MKIILRTIVALLLLVVLGVAALLLFFSTPEVPEAVLIAKYGQAPSQFLMLPSGTRVHYRDYAPTAPTALSAVPTLVLLHGSNASLHTWEPWAQRLRETMRVVTVDLPGHGLTGATVEADYSPQGMVEFVENFTRALGLDRPFLLAGNSMGGHIAWRYTLAHPDHVSKLILLDAAGVTAPEVKLSPPLAFRLARNRLTAPLVRHVAPRRLFASALRDAFYDKRLVTPEMVDRYWELNRRKGTPDATLARFRLPQDDPAMARLHEISVPTLVLWGREDALLPIALAGVYARNIPHVKVIVYDHCGHLPMEELADRSAADVREFVEGDKLRKSLF